MRVFVTADTHFNHANVIKYCDRPFSDAEEMNKELIRKWNDTVSPEDIVIHLGDVGFGQKENIINIVRSLNGKKILIKRESRYEKRKPILARLWLQVCL